MTEYQFWHREPELLEVYQRAYYKRIHEEAHLNGAYIYNALQIALCNAFRSKGKKTEKYLEKPYDPFEKIDKERNKKSLQELKEENKRGTQYQISMLNALSLN